MIEAIATWFSNHTDAIDGFIGGFIASVVVVTIYDKFAIVKRRKKE